MGLNYNARIFRAVTNVSGMHLLIMG
jgi:hypothetical protein